jgi:hypothetical protein
MKTADRLSTQLRKLRIADLGMLGSVSVPYYDFPSPAG